MQLLSILALTIAAVSAQTAAPAGVLCATEAATVPACARTCIDNLAVKEGCTLGDYKCACAATKKINAAATTCVATSCTLAEVPLVLPAVNVTCTCADPNWAEDQKTS